MSNQLLINCRPDQRRVAHIENGVTTELFFERVRAKGLVGNIYKGRVVRVLPGMQCAFLELGLQRTAFLYVGDVYNSDVKGMDMGPRSASKPDSYPPISELLKAGQELLVQVTKEPIGSKGARVTTQLGLPGRFIVFRPNTEHVGVSRRILDDDERERLTTLAGRIKPPHGGLIVRTVGAGLAEEDLAQDLGLLTAVWEELQVRIPTLQAPALLHEDLDLTLRSVRDLPSGGLDRVLVDDSAEADRIRAFVARSMPDFQGLVETWDEPDPMFERFGLEWEISRAVRREVWLRSGGSICIDRTEALVAIDVNTGRFVGRSSFEETAFQINLEAAREIAYQLRFRDIGGIIVIDFIDMSDRAHRTRVRDELITALKTDKARSHVLPMSELGLIEMTRKRVRESIVQSLTEPCFYCDGRGYLRAVEVVVDSVLSRLSQLVASGATGPFQVTVHPKVMESLIENCKEVLARIQEEHEVQIELQSSDDLHLEKVEIS